MLSDKTLERAGMSYAKGYHDGYAGREKQSVDNGIADLNDDTIGGTIKPFADYDYNKGYEAGVNDKKWSSK